MGHDVEDEVSRDDNEVEVKEEDVEKDRGRPI